MISVQMGRVKYVKKHLAFIGFLVAVLPVFGQGLRFTGGHNPIKSRTSLEIFHNKDVRFNQQFTISFDIRLTHSGSTGYVLRIKNKEQGAILNLHYEEVDDNAIFRLNEEGKKSLITAQLNKETVKEMGWFPVRIQIDLEKNSLALSIQNQTFTAENVPFPNPFSPWIFLGKSDHIIDVIPMDIKNLVVGNDRQSYVFPFREHDGELLHNDKGEALGRVHHPEWMINESYQWKKFPSYFSSSQAGSDYNESRQEVYYFNQDSILVYDLRSSESKWIPFISPCPIQLELGCSFLDEGNQKLYVYETRFDPEHDGPTVASLNLTDFTWTVESHQQLRSKLHHHSYFFDPHQNTFTIFGGYGDMSYSNQFHAFDLTNGRWNEAIDYQGESIIPRYFNAAGFSPDRKLVYLFGGMGNEAGKHVVGRKYFYDLHVLDLAAKQLKKRWEIDWKDTNIVPAEGIVIPDSNSLYVLGYAEHLTNSQIKLYQFSLEKGEYRILGDSIPIYSDRISTRAKLFYDEKRNKLLTLVQESTDDVSSKLSMYTLDYPPISAEELTEFPQHEDPLIGYILAGAFLLIVGIGGWIYRNRSLKPNELNTTLPLSLQSNARVDQKQNCIYLFGDFTVIDRQGKDISHLFSSRLKQTFCLMLFHSESGGISSTLLSHILWPDRPKEKVKTSRGVTINSLRKVLTELDGIEVIFKKGHFHLIISNHCHCDYTDCQRMIREGNTTGNPHFLSIISRGKFLLGADDALFDSAKETMESKLIPIVIQELQNNHNHQNHHKTIQISQTLFELDPLNEQALYYAINAFQALKLENKAKDIYRNFSITFSEMMGESFPHGYDEIVKKGN